MLLYFGANIIEPTDTTINKIEKKIGKPTGSLPYFKTYIIFCNDPKYYLGNDYIEFSFENLPSLFEDEIKNFKYIKLVCRNSG